MSMAPIGGGVLGGCLVFGFAWCNMCARFPQLMLTCLLFGSIVFRYLLVIVHLSYLLSMRYVCYVVGFY